MNKSKSLFRSMVSVATMFVVFSFVFVFALSANAASTIGANMSTTGTFTVTPATNSATSVQFQNTAGTNYFVGNSTRGWVGIGGGPSTVFEVQGTASASYLMTANTIQVGGVASVAYNRFGTTATSHSLSATNDVLINGLFEVDGNAFFDAKVGVNGGPSTVFEVQGTASASYFFTQNGIQVAGLPGATASVTWSRFGTGTAGHTAATEINATDDVYITGALELDGSAFLDGKASVSGNLQMSGRFIADTAASSSFTGGLLVTKSLVVGATTASNSGGLFVGEFVGSTTGTASFYFGGPAASSKGTCFSLKSTTGAPIYMRFYQGVTTPTLSTVRCQ